MPEGDKLARDGAAESTGDFGVTAPAISLPKGGGAIRGMGEKFAANPVTGTASLSIPILTSPGRSGFGPQLSLSYDSGAGNGPFGFGWNLSLPSITRKTDKGLPKYQDHDDTDVFILSGAEDLVPVMVDACGHWARESLPPRTVDGEDYRIQRYRPRTEGLFARIERWMRLSDGEAHWRSISKDNITTLYGKSANSRITDPENPHRIFSWLICESYDDKGNALLYEYTSEDSTNVSVELPNEKNRTVAGRAANRYLKRIKYGNKSSRLIQPDLSRMDWLFEVVFDYGEGHYTELPLEDPEGHQYARALRVGHADWLVRGDPFSSYRSGFEVRTYRLCRRVLMFHHFPDELDVDDYLVRSTEFEYEESPVASFITATTQSGYVREQLPDASFAYLKRSLPPLEFKYSKPDINETVEEIDPESLENLPAGLDGSTYQWVDLDGEGLSGILTEQAGGWYYKRNLSPLLAKDGGGHEKASARFAPLETVATRPSLAESGGRHRFLDLAGDGRQDVVLLERPVSGFYERTHDERWDPFRNFLSCPNVDWADPNLRFVDLTGDGHADILITENEAFTWYPSLAEDGFGPAEKARQALDEEKGPKLVFADGTQSIYLTDLSGDGLTDLARIRNGEVCYWPNLGYGRFGPKVTMDNRPRFDHADQFNQQRIRLADIDGSGTTDILYLGHDRIDIYRNQSGNSWGNRESLTRFPRIDNLTSVIAVDLLGNGTACLVWSSPLPSDVGRQMRYIDLMGGQKPHLLIKTVNNLGAETHIKYAPSTRFYLDDKIAGSPWVTKIPFPVHVVERVETYDRISRNRFVTRYAYHHGYFDGAEREFRGFGMVEQWDTEEFATFDVDGGAAAPLNVNEASHVPPVLTRTWFHTGVYLGRDHVSDFFAGLLDQHDRGEYYREPGLDDTQASKLLLDDTILPEGLTVEEEREACRALKGSMLRQEVYALDGPGTEDYPYGHPYTVTEQNFTIKTVQPREENRHAVFFTHAREALNYHYERNPADPRVAHQLTLEVGRFGNVLRAVAIGYGRRTPSTDPELTADDKAKQTRSLITYTENVFTNAVEEDGDYRTPLPAETRTYELTGVKPENGAARFSFDEWSRDDFNLPTSAAEIAYEETATHTVKQKRLIEHVRTLYRKDDMTALLPLGEVGPPALPGESYKLAFTPGLLAHVFKRKQVGQPDEDLLPIPAPLLEGKGEDQGGYHAMDGNWWIPSGRTFFDPDADIANPINTAAQELDTARNRFYLPRKFADPFDKSATVTYDRHDLLVTGTNDALSNVITTVNDYRVLQPQLVTDPNHNRTVAAFDALGMVVGTAVMGKPGENLGDTLDDFEENLTDATIAQHLQDPLVDPHDILKKASTCLVYDLFAYLRTRNDPEPQPAVVFTLTRENHDADLEPGRQTKVQHSFSYSDGFGREIQRKIQAEPEKTNGVLGPPRWVGSGWTVYNNKGKPVHQFEPFFTDAHDFEFDVRIGVSPVLFYDSVGRPVATLHPDHTYEKVVFDPWRQENWDVNDTVQLDPETDEHVGGFMTGYIADLRARPGGWETWFDMRTGGGMGSNDKDAAEKAGIHGGTPGIAHLDALGRAFLTIAHNKFERNGAVTEQHYATRVELDIEGNQRAVRDAIEQNGDAHGRIVMRFEYFIAGPDQDENGAPTNTNLIHQASMEAGERWILSDVAGNPVRAWDSRGFLRRMTYDELRRPRGLFVTENGAERLAEETVYGESQGDTANHRTRVLKMRDGAGVVTSEAYDFKGNLLSSHRRLLVDHKGAFSWNDNPALQGGTPFTNITTFDALNRPITITTPEGSIYRLTFNEANLLERVDVNLRGTAAVTPFVTNIDYDAKGQRLLIEYENGSQTEYEYDPETFRLIHLKTERPEFPAEKKVVQDLVYSYDPAGNITHIEDEAQPRTFFDNDCIDASNNYLYDAIYRLIGASGREHQGGEQPTGPNDTVRMGNAIPHDCAALRHYVERYEYDAVGNILNIVHHRGSNVGTPGQVIWHRRYQYATLSNRLRSTSLPAEPEKPSYSDDPTDAYGQTYDHDAHGNITSMPHVNLMQCDFQNQLQATSRQVVNDPPPPDTVPETTYYLYDAGGERVRKVTERQNGTLKAERLYLGGFEIYREYDGDGSTVTLERETLHIMDDQRRIALVETKTIEGGNPVNDPLPLQRYQLSNHLGSASVELDGNGALISYEEYHPYGTTAFQAGRNTVEVKLKRYRYTGKERDDETGFTYHGARYYAPWLGRWTSCDPLGLIDGPNVFAYAKNQPVNLTDPSGTQIQDEELPSQAYDLLTGVAEAMDQNESDDPGPSLLDQIGKGISTLWGEIKSAASAAWEGIKSAASAAWEGIKSAASAAWEGIKSAASAAWEGIKSAASAAWEGIKSAASAVWNWLTKDDGFIEDVFEVIGHLTWGSLGTAIGAALTAVNLTVGNLITAVHNIFTKDANDWEYASISIGGPNDEDDIIGNYGGLFNLAGLGAAVTIGPFVFFGGSPAETTASGATGVKDYYRSETPRYGLYGSKQGLRTAAHEEGHEDQNLVYGPFAPILGLLFSLVPGILRTPDSSWAYWFDRQANRWSGKNSPFNPNPNVHP